MESAGLFVAQEQKWLSQCGTYGKDKPGIPRTILAQGFLPIIERSRLPDERFSFALEYDFLKLRSDRQVG